MKFKIACLIVFLAVFEESLQIECLKCTFPADGKSCKDGTTQKSSCPSNSKSCVTTVSKNTINYDTKVTRSCAERPPVNQGNVVESLDNDWRSASEYCFTDGCNKDYREPKNKCRKCNYRSNSFTPPDFDCLTSSTRSPEDCEVKTPANDTAVNTRYIAQVCMTEIARSTSDLSKIVLLSRKCSYGYKILEQEVKGQNYCTDGVSSIYNGIPILKRRCFCFQDKCNNQFIDIYCRQCRHDATSPDLNCVAGTTAQSVCKPGSNACVTTVTKNPKIPSEYQLIRDCAIRLQTQAEEECVPESAGPGMTKESCYCVKDRSEPRAKAVKFKVQF